jgi:hypothetical protein
MRLNWDVFNHVGEHNDIKNVVEIQREDVSCEQPHVAKAGQPPLGSLNAFGAEVSGQ